ncbi:ASKHA domain-containing protein [Candidatus Bathyarchaeota archaeon]|nr:ASKHA domain-containing protein [Candidatus Bathyarchaeota archaeon]
MVEHVQILFDPMNIRVVVKVGAILLDAIREADLRVESICGGKGDCGKCKVILVKGEVSELSTKSQRHLSPQQVSEGYYLACQIQVMSDCIFRIPVESRIEKPKILLDIPPAIDKPNPASKKYLAKRLPPQDYEQLLLPASINLEDYSGSRPRMSDEISSRIRAMEEDALMTVTLSRSNNYPEIVDVEPGDRTGSNYGLAIDVGTTTIVVALVDLTNGKVLGTESALNKQITYGEELVTRIAFGSEPEGLKKLQSTVVSTINDLVDRLADRVGKDIKEITDVTVSGNTVMNHLLAGISPSYLDEANVKVSRKPIIRKSKDIGLHANPEAYIYCLPNVSRFLGGDAISDVIVSGTQTSEDVSLIVDMGTNGEIIFGNRDWLVSCSCASGPAWEGEGIKFGMRGMDGGIDHIKIDPNTLEASYTVIGDTLPKGICGSGIIDVSAEMFSVGILDFTGKIVAGKMPLVRSGRDGLEYVVATREKTAIDQDIVITQQDMAYIIDSKAAVCGAIMVLMKKYNLSIYDVKNFCLAGAFGAYTDLENATKLGVFPEFPNAKIHPIGNGSLAGAYSALLSNEKRQEAEDAAEKMMYIDLILDTDFIETYSLAVYIPGKKELFPSYKS